MEAYKQFLVFDFSTTTTSCVTAAIFL